MRVVVCSSRCASAGCLSSVHPSGTSDPTLLQHAPSEPSLLSWARFHVTRWSSLAPLSPLLHDSALGDISCPCVTFTKLVSASSTRFMCSALDTAYPTLRPLAFAFKCGTPLTGNFSHPLSSAVVVRAVTVCSTRMHMESEKGTPIASQEYALVSALRDTFGQDLPCMLLELHVA